MATTCLHSSCAPVPLSPRVHLMLAVTLCPPVSWIVTSPKVVWRVAKSGTPGPTHLTYAVRYYLLWCRTSDSLEGLALYRTTVRRKQNGRAPRGDFEARVHERGTHALARFLHGVARKPDDGPGGEAAGDVDFDEDGVRVDAEDRGGVDGGEHGAGYIGMHRRLSSQCRVHRRTNAAELRRDVIFYLVTARDEGRRPVRGAVFVSFDYRSISWVHGSIRDARARQRPLANAQSEGGLHLRVASRRSRAGRREGAKAESPRCISGLALNLELETPRTPGRSRITACAGSGQ